MTTRTGSFREKKRLRRGVFTKAGRLLFLRFRVRQVGDATFEHFSCQTNGLVQSRVSVDGQRDVFSVTAHFDRQTNFTQQLAAVGTDNRTTDTR